MPLFDNVTDFAELFTPTVWSPKTSVLALSDASGAAMAVPVPSRAVTSALEFDVTFSDAARSAATVGLNVTLIVQLAPAASAAPQVLVLAKSAEFVPPTVILLIVNAAVTLVFLSVATCAMLVVLII